MKVSDFSDISKFRKILSLSRLATREVTRIYRFIAINDASFHLS